MNAYRVAWLVACGGLALVGVSSALVISIPAMIALFIGAALFTGVLVVSLAAACTDHPGELSGRTLLRLVVRGSFLGGTAAVALIGLTALLHAWALLAVGVVGVGSVPALRCSGRRLHDRFADVSPGPRPADITGFEAPAIESISAVESAVDLSSLSDTDLCQAWRASFSVLESASTSSQRARIAEARQKYLDELERRNREGLLAWLASGARAAADPSRYFLESPTRRRSIDWDELIR
jgi:hypothetical protein